MFDLKLQKEAAEAHRYLSFTPERAGNFFCESLESVLAEKYENLEALAATAEQRNLLTERWAAFMSGYRGKLIVYLGALSRTASPRIVGPAKFPTRSNNKKRAIADKRDNDATAWRENALKKIEKDIKALAPAGSVPPIEQQAFMQSVQESALCLLGIANGTQIYNRSLILGALYRKVAAQHRLGRQALVNEALDYLQAANTSPKLGALIAKQAKIWKLREPLPAEPPEAPAKPKQNVEEQRGAVKVVLNYEAQRYQLFFDAKPDAAMCFRLKKGGWAWAPSKGAWQRKITANTENWINRNFPK